MVLQETPRPNLGLPLKHSLAEDILSGNARGWKFGRHFFGALPSAPRCKLCAAPFRPPFSPLMRVLGKTPWPKNPSYCSGCYNYLLRHRGGAEVAASLLFADVRGSTTLAESMRPGAFTALMGRFFELGARVLATHDAIIDKFVGDEIVGIFITSLAGPRHAARAIDAGRELLRVMGEREPGLPIGVGVHTGVAYVGTVGEGTNVDLTAMGDPVNVTARLASAAGAGELLVTLAAATAAGLSGAGLERRSLALKGKSEPTEVLVFGPASAK
ncbi:MAG: adenylate/guanylate cyclase domain-containing protein [Candidatus Limnocylindrales bacterium]